MVSDGCQCCAQAGVRVDGVHLAGFNKRGHSGPLCGRPHLPRQEGILSIEGYGTDGVFDGVRAHLDTAISQEDLQTTPVPMDMARRLAKAGGREDQKAIRGIVFPNDAALMGQELVEVGDP